MGGRGVWAMLDDGTMPVLRWSRSTGGVTGGMSSRGAEEGCHQVEGAPLHPPVWCSGFPVARAGLALCVVQTAFRDACFCQLFAMAQAGEEWSSPAAGWAWSPVVARERCWGLS